MISDPTTTERTAVLQLTDVEKRFGRLHALQGVTLTLHGRERMVLVGPNGAGKSTLIRCLCGLTRPDSGELQLLGQPIASPGIRDAIGLVPQEIALYGDLTTKENLEVFARFHGVRGRTRRDRIAWAMKWTGLEDRANDLVGKFSGGMKRRINLACGVMHNPQVLLLDEPTVGVDPQSRQRINEMLDELNEQGTSILLTTHQLDEAESFSDRIVVMDHGKIIADGTREQLVQRSIGDRRMVRIRVDRPLREPIPTPHGVEAGLHDDQDLTGEWYCARIDDVARQLPELLDTVQKTGYDVRDVQVSSPSLHHVLMHLTGRELRD